MVSVNYKQKRINSIILTDHVDTTATNSLAAYDRIIVYGENINKLVSTL
jgi:hypothetical protein